MCGIAGIYRLTGTLTAADVAAVLRMTDAQVHRGPDDWGLLVPESVAATPEVRSLARAGRGEHVRTYPDSGAGPSAVLGARRLSILDLSERGRMPMGSADGRLWIAHNGEIYDYRELRAELGGDSFHSDTDTEVILRGYAAWGEEVVPRLRGMFAFALFEAAPRPRLLLARDRLGVKPLYWSRDRERFVFASEVGALLRSGIVPDETNTEAFVRFLQLGSIPAPQTTVREVTALGAGQLLVVGSEGATARRYWDLSAHRAHPCESAVAGKAAVANARALLEESTQLHLLSDVPLGIFLSGGMDSAGLVALSSQARKAPVTTLSVTFDEPAYDEGRYARLVADRYRTDHHELVVRGPEFFARLRGVLGAMDEPTVDGVNTYFVAEAAKRIGLKVVLSGAGGDELFLGYGHFRRAATFERIRMVLGSLPRTARRSVIRSVVAGGTAAGRDGLEKLEYLVEPSPESFYLAARGLFGPRQIQELVGIGSAELDALGPAFTPLAGASRGVLDAFERLEFAHYLQNQLLKDTDVMSMAHSLEVRVPYLDHRLVECVAALPAGIKLGRDRPKALLLDALGEALPRAVWDRPKMGFTLPFDPWMRQRAGELEAQTLESKKFERRAVETIWRKFRAGRVHWSRPWALLVLAAFDAARRQRAAA